MADFDLNFIFMDRQCSDWPGLSGIPGSSRICTAVASPICFQSCSTQTTFLSGVTSMSWGPPLFLPREVKMVFPFASRVQLCGAEVNWYSAGRSVLQWNSQIVSPLELTSRVRLL